MSLCPPHVLVTCCSNASGQDEKDVAGTSYSAITDHSPGDISCPMLQTLPMARAR